MTKKASKSKSREPLSKEELRRLSTYDVVKLKLTDEEMRLLREINDERRKAIEARGEVFAEDEVSLVADLNKAGLEVTSVWDLVNTRVPYPEAIPVLVRHLNIPHLDRVVEGIARALAVREAMPLWSFLLEKYKSTADGVDSQGFRLGAKDGLAVALSVICAEETLIELIELLRDRSQGRTRTLLLSALRNSKDPRAKQAIEELSFDPQLATEIATWTKRKDKRIN